MVAFASHSDRNDDSSHVVQPGDRVKVGLTYADSVDAVILEILIKQEGVLYLCAWWAGDGRYTAWVSPCEIFFIDEGDD